MEQTPTEIPSHNLAKAIIALSRKIHELDSFDWLERISLVKLKKYYYFYQMKTIKFTNQLADVSARSQMIQVRHCLVIG